MRSLWNGSLSFGLVNIPIHVYSAAEERSLDFDMLHKKDLSPIRFARICKLDGQEIPYSEIVKGYEIEKGEYVIIEKEDFKRANPKKTSSIEIIHFVELSEIDPIFYHKPYFLEPDKKSGKAYSLFREALLKSKKGALVRFVFHQKEHMGIISPLDNVLLLMQIRYLSEIRPSEELTLPKEERGSKAELEMALKLIDELTVHFEPEKYHDTYTEELLHTIEEKAKGHKPKKAKEPLKHIRAHDLMHLLKMSLENTMKEEKNLPSKRKSLPLKTKREKKKRRST